MRSNRPSKKINDLIRKHIWAGHTECTDWEEAVDMVFSDYNLLTNKTLPEKAKFLEFWFNVFVEELQSSICNEFILDAVIAKFLNWLNKQMINESHVNKLRADLTDIVKFRFEVLKTLNNEEDN